MKRSTRVLQATAWYPPHHTGGTEVYLADLIANLPDHDACVLTPQMPGAAPTYAEDGVEVRTYRPASQGEAASRAAFQRLLEDSGAAIYHQHSWTPDCGGWHLAAARRAGLKTVLTVHTPASLCLRGTMMRMGQTACDGRVDINTCAACWAQSRGAPRWLAQGLSRIAAPDLPMLPARVRTALAARGLVERRQDDLVEMIDDADRLVAVCGWLHSAMLLNGAPEDRLRLSRQGTSEAFLAAGLARPKPDHSVRRLLFLGRWDPVKGAGVAVRALVAEPDLDVTLTLHGIAAGPAEAAHRDEVTALARNDRRIRLEGPAPHEALPAIMAAHDALIIPSTWMETGPLVALEALAAGLYVMGSDLGGIAEMIDQPWKGTLVAPGNIDAWRAALRTLAGTTPPARPADAQVRTMAAAAKDMSDLYAELA